MGAHTLDAAGRSYFSDAYSSSVNAAGHSFFSEQQMEVGHPWRPNQGGMPAQPGMGGALGVVVGLVQAYFIN